MSADSEFPQKLPRRRASPVPPIEQDIEPSGLDGVAATERVQLARDRFRHKAQVGRDRLMTGLVAIVLAVGGGAVFTDRLEAESFVVGLGTGLIGYFVRGQSKE